MTNNPIERLRTKLSPINSLLDIFKIEILINGIEISKEQKLNQVIKDVLKRDIENRDDIEKHLKEAEELLDQLGFETKELN
jgi:hypothetical protein